jgi:hypothetical protein
MPISSSRAAPGHFPGADLMAMLRRRPHPALLALLNHRLNRIDPKHIRRRTMIGRLLRDELSGNVDLPGKNALAQTHCVFRRGIFVAKLNDGDLGLEHILGNIILVIVERAIII